jgi:hypothetical protein
MHVFARKRGLLPIRLVGRVGGGIPYRTVTPLSLLCLNRMYIPPTSRPNNPKRADEDSYMFSHLDSIPLPATSEIKVSEAVIMRG